MKDQKVDEETLRVIKHDIKNQLSNIHLALVNIRYEVPNPTEDFTFCMETIASSTEKINSLLTTLD